MLCGRCRQVPFQRGNGDAATTAPPPKTTRLRHQITPLVSTRDLVRLGAKPEEWGQHAQPRRRRRRFSPDLRLPSMGRARGRPCGTRSRLGARCVGRLGREPSQGQGWGPRTRDNSMGGCRRLKRIIFRLFRARVSGKGWERLAIRIKSELENTLQPR